jgi:hypothetical protein
LRFFDAGMSVVVLILIFSRPRIDGKRCRNGLSGFQVTRKFKLIRGIRDV